jgi:bifunctional ADP-heptose synthase (sugar kinase/adenylyltransferase)
MVSVHLSSVDTRASATTITPNAAELTQLGGEGLTVCRAYGSPYEIPAESSHPVDVTGCGDIVVTALAIELACGEELEGAALAASVVAGVAVAQAGTVAVAERLAWADEYNPRGSTG